MIDNVEIIHLSFIFPLILAGVYEPTEYLGFGGPMALTFRVTGIKVGVYLKLDKLIPFLVGGVVREISRQCFSLP
jgi:hypothetical protein